MARSGADRQLGARPRPGSSTRRARTSGVRSRSIMTRRAGAPTSCSPTSGTALVQLSLSLLRAEVWGTGRHLHRVALRYAAAALGIRSRSPTGVW